MSKLKTDAQRRERWKSIAKAYDEGVSTAANARRRECSPATVYNAISHLRWGGGPSPDNPRQFRQHTAYGSLGTAAPPPTGGAEKRLIGAKANVLLCEAEVLEERAKALRAEATAILKTLGVSMPKPGNGQDNTPNL